MKFIQQCTRWHLPKNGEFAPNDLTKGIKKVEHRGVSLEF